MKQPEEAVAVEGNGIRAISVGDFMSRELVTVKESDDLALAEQMLRLMDSLEDHEDIQNVYSNFDISDEVAEKIGR